MPLAIKVGNYVGIIDQPSSRKVHHVPTPRTGGAAVIIGCLVPFFVMGQMGPQLMGYIFGAICLAAFGVWDDLKNINYKVKFLGQILASLIFLETTGIRLHTLGELLPGISFSLGIFEIPVSVIFLLATINIINLSDGLDALASGLSLLTFVSAFMLALFEQEVVLMLMIASLSGATLGFLLYNLHPAKVFLGDTGSQLLGYSMGVFLLTLTQQQTIFNPVLMLFILGLPVIDTMSVIIQRVMKGKNPFRPDKNHLHHKLLEYGLDHSQAVILLYFFHIMLVLVGLRMRYAYDYWLIFTYMMMLLSIFGVIILINKSPAFNKTLTLLSDNIVRKPLRVVKQSRARYYFSKASWKMLFLSFTTLFILPPFFIEFSIYITLYAVIAIILILYMRKSSSHNDILLRVASFVILCFYVFVIVDANININLLNKEIDLFNVIFALMAASFTLALILTPEKKPFDALDFIFVAAIVFLFFIPTPYIERVSMPVFLLRILLVGLTLNLIFSRIERNRGYVVKMLYFTLALAIVLSGVHFGRSLL
jgi:UDP-GlcNAc:undecaprenyl-phosphate GlcNAc-1-phosphate transferase